MTSSWQQQAAQVAQFLRRSGAAGILVVVGKAHDVGGVRSAVVHVDTVDHCCPCAVTGVVK